MLLSTATDQTHRPAVWPAGYRHQRRNRPYSAGRATGLIAALRPFPELSRIHRRCSSCRRPRSQHLSLLHATPTFTPGRRAVCRLLCRPDRPEPAAGRALRAHLSGACADSDTAKAIEIRHSGRVLEGTAGGPISSLEGKRLCHARGASLCPASLISNTNVARPDQLRLILSAPSVMASKPLPNPRSCIADLGWEHGNVHGSDWRVSDTWTPAAG